MPQYHKPQKREQKQEIYQPTIIRTKNITPLSFKPTIVKTGKITQLKLASIQEIIKTPHKTQLHLSTNKPEIYVHEVKPHHYSTAQIASYLAFGIIIGAAITILMFAR